MNARVLIVASEAVPLIKTGGLADVVSSLAHKLRQRGVDARILLPAYPAAFGAAIGLRQTDSLPDLPGGAGTLWQGQMPDTGVPVILLKTDGFDRRQANPYIDDAGAEHGDNALCFGALAHAAARICAGATSYPVPQVVHANDWHAGLIPLLLHLNGVRDVASIFTIHNLAFQGNFPLQVGGELGLPPEMLAADQLEFWGQLSFLKAGILYADRISTVSRSYAQEILTPRFGHGMDGILSTRRDALAAIPNGVDTELWDPATDVLIARRFHAGDLRGKAVCKQDLQLSFGLPVDRFAPVIAIGSRITHQKMADVALAALPSMLEQHPRAQVVVLGCGERAYEEGFRSLAAQYRQRVGVFIGYDEERAHALHAGADLLLHGTRFEPFGLTPLYAMRYGTLPIASRVGGMIDSIVDAGDGTLAPGASGFLFDGETPEDMQAAVARALAQYELPNAWHVMQRNAMGADFSWNGPAEQYIDLYRQLAPDFTPRQAVGATLEPALAQEPEAADQTLAVEQLAAQQSGKPTVYVTA